MSENCSNCWKLKGTGAPSCYRCVVYENKGQYVMNRRSRRNRGVRKPSLTKNNTPKSTLTKNNTPKSTSRSASSPTPPPTQSVSSDSTIKVEPFLNNFPLKDIMPGSFQQNLDDANKNISELTMNRDRELEALRNQLLTQLGQLPFLIQEHLRADKRKDLKVTPAMQNFLEVLKQDKMTESLKNFQIQYHSLLDNMELGEPKVAELMNDFNIQYHDIVEEGIDIETIEFVSEVFLGFHMHKPDLSENQFQIESEHHTALENLDHYVRSNLVVHLNPNYSDENNPNLLSWDKSDRSRDSIDLNECIKESDFSRDSELPWSDIVNIRLPETFRHGHIELCKLMIKEDITNIRLSETSTQRDVNPAGSSMMEEDIPDDSELPRLNIDTIYFPETYRIM